jgi:hypothetical protein
MRSVYIGGFRMDANYGWEASKRIRIDSNYGWEASKRIRIDSNYGWEVCKRTRMDQVMDEEYVWELGWMKSMFEN